MIEEFERYDSSIPIEATHKAGDMMVEERILSTLREKDAQIQSLRDTIFTIQKSKVSQSPQEQDMAMKILRS